MSRVVARGFIVLVLGTVVNYPYCPRCLKTMTKTTPMILFLVVFVLGRVLFFFLGLVCNQDSTRTQDSFYRE